jgi:hypothetical protein
MNISVWFFLGCLMWVVSPLVCWAGQTTDFLEQFPKGSINWTRGQATASGSASFPDVKGVIGPDAPYEKARLRAVRNLRSTLERLRLSGQSCIEDLLPTQAYIQDQLEAMTLAADILNMKRNADGDVEITLGISFYGGFSQLILPSDIRQVQSIRPLNGIEADNGDAMQIQGGKYSPPTIASDVYTGLIVDARGIGAAPSMVPVLVDENGREVYGPAFVSREFAVQNGMCRYMRGADIADDLTRVAPNPLRVKGLESVPDNSCYIVISNSDASRLHGVSYHLEFLKQCRVVILLDE